jgi:hypothetical protein
MQYPRRRPPHSIFIEGFRTPATVQAASLRSAGIRNPQQTRKSLRSLDHFVGLAEQHGRHGEAERIRGLAIDDELEFYEQRTL